MRIFLAVFPPPEVQDTAFSVIESLRTRGDGVSWVKRDNLHFTMRFLGEIGEDGAGRVTEAAREAAAATAAFGATLGEPGAFPTARRPRVLWLGLGRGAAELVGLAKRLEAALARGGFEPEAREFSPHLTIGRVREPGPDWTAALRGAAPVAGPREFRVQNLAVVQSQLNPRGSIYTVLENAPLAG